MQDGYRSVLFHEDTDARNHSGLTLSETARGKVSDDCLRWHFHQTVITWVRGLGEPYWDREVLYENVCEFGDWSEEDKELQEERVKEILVWEAMPR